MIIFLYGPDTFRASQKISELESKFIAEVDPTASSVAFLEGSKATIAELSNLFRPLSLFVKRRLVVFKNPLSNKQGEFVAELDEFLITEKNNDNILIIHEPNFVEKKIAGKNLIMKPGADDKVLPLNKAEKKLFDHLNKSQFVQYFGTLSPAELSKYIVNLAKQAGTTLPLPLAQLLIRLAGSDLWTLSQEINKLSAYVLGKGEEAVIKESDIRKLVSQSVTDSIFALTDALGNKQSETVVRLLNEQLQSGAHPSYILTMILWQFKTLASVRQALDSGRSTKELGKILSLHPYVLEKSINQVRKFTFPTLQATINRLIDIDYRSKQGEGDLEELLPVALIHSS